MINRVMPVNYKKGSVLIIDDNPLVLDALKSLLDECGYTSIACSSAVEAIDAAKELTFDVVLTDVKMPEISGLTLLETMHNLYPEIPVIIMTGHAELDTAVKAINMRAFDFLTKPFSPENLVHTVQKALEYSRLRANEQSYKTELESIVQRRTQELNEALIDTRNMNIEVIQRFTRIAEYRDTDTGDHISRMGYYSNKLAEALNMPEDFINCITFASSMHDIGKIGIPDNILLKPGSLTSDEFEVMKTHTVIGGKILEHSTQPIIQMAETIALTHHERWDGTGYPGGLRGDDIPLAGMIVMIVDQYDALRSIRPYKPSLSHEETFKIITEGDGRTNPEHFKPEILNAFVEVAPVFDEIFIGASLTDKLESLIVNVTPPLFVANDRNTPVI